MEGIIRFLGFDVEQIYYSKNKQFNSQVDEVELKPKFLFKIAQNDTDNNQFNIILGVKLGINEADFPFKVEAGLRGYYEFRKDEHDVFKDEDSREVLKFCLMNGCAILFPYLRSLLTDITSKSNHNPIILPTLNFQKFINQQDLNSLIADSSEYQNMD